MKKITTLLTTMLAVTVCSSAQTSDQYADSVTDSGLYNTMLITGGKPRAELLAQDNWLYPEFLSAVGKPDSECNIFYRHGGEIVTAMKSTVYQLFPEVKSFKINNKDCSKAEFDIVPASFIEYVDYKDGVLSIITRKNVNEGNSPFWDASYKSYVWQQKQFAKKNTDIISRTLGNAKLADFSTYPKDLLLTYDNYIHFPEQVADFTSIQIVGLGDYLNVVVFSNNQPISTIGSDIAKFVSLDAGHAKSKTVAELIAMSGIPANEVNAISYNGDAIVIASVKPYIYAEHQFILPMNEADNKYIGQWRLISENGKPQHGYSKVYDKNGNFQVLRRGQTNEAPDSKVTYYEEEQRGKWFVTDWGFLTEACEMGDKGEVLIQCILKNDTLYQTFAYDYAPDILYHQIFVRQPMAEWIDKLNAVPDTEISAGRKEE